MANLNTIATTPGIYQYTLATLGTRPTEDVGCVIHMRRGATGAAQILLSITGGVYHRATESGVWPAWNRSITLLDKATQEQAEAGINADQYMSALRVAQAITGRRFEALAGSWPTGGRVARAHGLGIRPYQYSAGFRCKVANNGWAVGAEIDAPNGTTGGVSGIYAASDATNVYAVIRATVSAPTFDGTGSFTVSNSDWDIVLRAEK